MLDDDIRSVSGFYTADSDDTHENEVSKSDHIFQDDNASAEHLSLQDHMYHISFITDSLKGQLPSLLSDALKYTLPQLLKDSIKSFVLTSIAKELPYVEAHVQKNLQDQFSNLLLKPMKIFVLLQKKLNNSLHKNMKKSIKLKEKQPSAQDVKNEKAMVIHNPKEKKEGTISIEDDSDNDDLDKQPLSKRFKIMTPIPNLILLNTFVPKNLLNPEEQEKSLHDFTNQLFETTSSKFSPTPPREPTPLKDPAKGKEITIVKEQVNELVTYQDKRCYIPKMPKLKSFITLEGTLSQEELNNQIKELKRIIDLKAQKDKSEQELRKMFNQATLKAHAKK
uniref:Uncharacterized protein n=1 Tax=Tanacetum cinerariifolium TaxID=118510 RepID=A0A6L2P101_TANCI|nr:hypothetical protein [Tanacetum cinerariifolium]